MADITPIAGRIFFKNYADFDSELIRAFAYDKDFGPTFGECISTAMKITEGDFDSWYTEWKATADKLYEIAESSYGAGFNESAKQNYLAASVCYRTADLFIRQNLDDERIIPLADMQRKSFRKGMEFFDFGFEVLNIPYESTTLDGYLFTVDKSGKPRPTLIFIGGYDSFVEETFYSGVYQALLRGYNVLSFDGPGQGQVLRRQKLYFRPDWENVVKPVKEYAKTLAGVDSDSLIIFGRSFAGYLGPRTACHDSDYKAIIADAALFNLGGAITQKFPPELLELVKINMDDKVEEIFSEKFKDKATEFYFKSRMSTHGAKTVAEYIRMLFDYSIEGIAQNIKIPALIAAGEYDSNAVSESQKLFDAISSEDKTLCIFKGDEGAGEHCESANQTTFYTKVFNWLDERIKK